MPFGVDASQPLPGARLGRSALRRYRSLDILWYPGRAAVDSDRSPREGRAGENDDVIAYQALELCQYEDEELVLVIGNVVFPGRFDRSPEDHRIRMWVEGVPNDATSRAAALARFQITLGTLRCWNGNAGELEIERLGGLGPAAVRDRSGNQWMQVGPAVMYITGRDQVEVFARRAHVGVTKSVKLRDALQLYGRANRTAAEYYMALECAQREFGDRGALAAGLGVSRADITRLASSTNNLAPFDGGRHAHGEGSDWDLDRQRRFVAELLRSWINRVTDDELNRLPT